MVLVSDIAVQPSSSNPASFTKRTLSVKKATVIHFMEINFPLKKSRAFPQASASP